MKRRIQATTYGLALLMLAACSSGGSTAGGNSSAAAGSSGAAAGSSSAAAASSSAAAGSSSAAGGKEIVIGNIGSYTGPQSGSIGPTKAVLEAWAADTNAAGGIGGRPVRLVIKDDGSNATTSLGAAKELVETEKVVAIVSDMSLFDSAWAKYISGTGVPVIGGQPFQTPFFKEQDFFPSGTNAVARSYGELLEAKKIGPTFGSLYCAEAPACKTGADIFVAFAPSLGMKVPVVQSVSASSPNFTAQCQALIDAGVNAYHTAHANQVTIRIQDACFAQGLKAPQVATGGIATDQWLPLESLQGTINIELNFPYFDSSIPATKAYQDFLDKHSLREKVNGSLGTYAYVGAKLFEKAAAGVGTAEIAPASLKTALYAMKGETLEGLAPPLTFNPKGPTLINCWFLGVIQNKKWVAPRGVKTQCAPDDLVAKVAGSVG